MNEMELIKYINENILKDFDVELTSFEKASKKSILAYYSLSTKTIHINFLNKQVFNDYYVFIETMLHEQVHLINHSKGIEDVTMDGEMQDHNRAFRSLMLEKYNMYCDSTSANGGVDFYERRNEEMFKSLIVKRVKHKKFFEIARENYLKNIYKDLKIESEDYKKSENPYSHKEEEGEEF